MTKKDIDTETLLKSQREAKDTAKAYHHNHHQILRFSRPLPSGVTWGVRASFQFLSGFFITLIIVLVYLIKGYSITNVDHRLEVGHCSGNERLLTNDTSPSSSSSSKCDLFSGKWVYDDKSRPLYKEKQCSFMSDHVACEKNGRKDLGYQNLRWQPHQCDLPRFNATTLLERLRNKRLVYVGDSLNRGQWESMVCLVEASISSPSLKSIDYLLNASLTIFKAIEYNATIEFYWAPLLVESNSDDALQHTAHSDRIVRVKAIEKHARHWSDAHVLVFDSYLWWRTPTVKLMWGSFGSAEAVYKEMPMQRSYEMALETWADWLQVHVNRSNTLMFWATMSPSHERGEEWGAPAGSTCCNETEPIATQGYWGSGSYPEMFKAVERVIDKLDQTGLKVQLLNITQLSEYRKEAHVSIYGKKRVQVNKTRLTNPTHVIDCFHWCLPGVPDAWNELLYASLLNSFL